MTSGRAYYHAPVAIFLETDSLEILGKLVQEHAHALEELQRNAWRDQLKILKDQLRNIPSAHLFLEFSIPRMGKRADAILLWDGVVFVIEFKVGATLFEKSAQDQVTDYALDLSNFHEASHDRSVVPVLVSTNGISTLQAFAVRSGVSTCIFANANDLAEVLFQAYAGSDKWPISALDWANSRYKPTPTIVEAAQALYHGHSVEEISRYEAGVTNLSATSTFIADIIQKSKSQRLKSICFVTGVPGAGKTLAGLNLACARKKVAADEHAVFLSGNGPLVIVLREALARDQVAREGVTKKKALSEASSFIQNIHHFRDDSLVSPAAPVERVVIFDEAQRAWDREHVANFMAKKKGVRNWELSEPEFLISIMDRHEDWCTVVCLVGGGQEINDGEAGIIEWFTALKNRFPDWHIWCSDKLGSSDYVLGQTVEEFRTSLKLSLRQELHLGVSVRSFRAELLSEFVQQLLDGNTSAAKGTFDRICDQYPVVFTRDLRTAKQWLKEHARGSERFGLLAHSGALRLKAEGVHVKTKVKAADYFLNERYDVRSSYYLEDVATEFDVQGLELDWTCVCWDADLRREDGHWTYNEFSGASWRKIHKAQSQRYLKNSYRVLLTRARQGMIIHVPEGAVDDPTRVPDRYDALAEYLSECGIPRI